MIYTTESYERDLIGGILYDTSLLEQLKVKPDQLQGNIYKTILQAITELYNDKQEVDAITVYEKVKDKSNIIPSDLTTLSKNAMGINSKSFDSIQNVILEAYNKKTLEIVLLNALNSIQEQGDYEKVKSDLKAYCDEKEVSGVKVTTINEALTNTIEILEKRIRGEVKGMYTGFESMDNCLHGIQKKNFYIVGARPSVGKTAFALSLGERLGIENKGIFFSLEMSKEQLCERIIASKSDSKMDNIIKGSINDDEMLRILGSLSELSERKIDMVDDEYTTLEEIERICRRTKRKKGLDFIIIDYLTLIHSEKRFNTIREEVNHISRSLKILSNKLDIAVICLTQLNREVEKRQSNVPIMADIRESGQIEQDANVIMFLSNPVRREDGKIEEIEDVLRVDIKKNRNGKSNVAFHLFYEKDTQKLIAFDKEQEKKLLRSLQ